MHELAPLLDKGTLEDCIEFFRRMPEAERRKLARDCLRRHREADSYPAYKKKHKVSMRVWTGRQQRITVAALATASPEELSRASIVFRDDPHWQVLAHRGKQWAQSWADYEVAQIPRQWWRVERVREAVHRKLCRPPEDENWAVGHIAFFAHPRSGRGNVLSKLRKDPRFLKRDIWKLFEHEGTPDCNLAAVHIPRLKTPGDNWDSAIVALSAEGALSRKRLLDASLAALARDFVPRRAGWFSRFHEMLEPTLTERAARLDRYLLLLGSTNPPTVTFATHALETLSTAGRLKTQSLVPAMEPVLLGKNKGPAILGLRLLDQCLTANPKQALAIAHAAAQGLLHRTADVQKQSFALLAQAYPDPTTAPDTVRDAVRAAADLLAASIRKRAEPWLTTGTPRRAAKHDATTQRHEAVLAKPVAPITKPEDLLLELGAVLEDATDPMALERITAGLIAFRDADLTPLSKRAKQLCARFRDEDPDPFRYQLAHWVADRPKKRKLPWTWLRNLEGRRSPAVLYATRLEELLADPDARVPLSLPTDSRGFIQPSTLVQRALKHEPNSLTDQVLALLRLGRKGRTKALEQRCAKLPSEFGRALRYALGNDRIRIGSTAALWIAAARARDPLGDDLRVDRAHPKAGPGGARAARYELRTKLGRKVGHSRRYIELYLDRTPTPPKRVPVTHPTVQFHTGVRYKYSGSIRGPASCKEGLHAAGEFPSTVRWAATIAPLCTEDYFSIPIEWIDVEWHHVQHEVRYFFEPMLYADVALGPNAYRLLALGLAAKESGQWGIAVECVLAGIADRRLRSTELGDAMAELLPTGIVTARRWARSLAEVARASSHCGKIVREAIATALRGDPNDAPRDIAYLLELLYELQAADDSALTASEVRQYLTGLSASGRVGKLRKLLLHGD